MAGLQRPDIKKGNEAFILGDPVARYLTVDDPCKY